MVTEVLIGRHPEIWIMSGDRSDVRVGQRVCEVFSASGFVQTQNGLVNGLCVRHWNLFCVIDSHQLHGMNCLCGMPKWQLIEASVEKQSLVVMIKARPCVA